MTQHRDSTARRIAIVALAAAFGGYFYGAARADEVSEPDAAALAVRVNVLELQVADLQANTNGDAINTLTAQVNDLEDESVSGCLAYSDYHYFRESVHPHGHRWRMPVVVWNMADPLCRPDPHRTWKPKRRITTAPLLRSP